MQSLWDSILGIEFWTTSIVNSMRFFDNTGFLSFTQTSNALQRMASITLPKLDRGLPLPL